MIDAKPTKGKWTIGVRGPGRYGDEGRSKIYSRDGYLVATAVRRAWEEETLANAKLIARAPEMMAALLRLYESDDRCDCDNHESRDCCVNVKDFCCPHCIAGAVLAGLIDFERELQ